MLPKSLPCRWSYSPWSGGQWWDSCIVGTRRHTDRCTDCSGRRILPPRYTWCSWELTGRTSPAGTREKWPANLKTGKRINVKIITEIQRHYWFHISAQQVESAAESRWQNFLYFTLSSALAHSGYEHLIWTPIQYGPYIERLQFSCSKWAQNILPRVTVNHTVRDQRICCESFARGPLDFELSPRSGRTLHTGIKRSSDWCLLSWSASAYLPGLS